MQRLYVAVQGATVGRTSERLVVRKDGVTVREVRARDLEEVHLFGHAQLTPDALAYVLKKGIDVFFLTRTGRYRGQLVGAESHRVKLRRAQYAATAEELLALRIAGRLLSQKTRFLAYVLRRGTGRADDAIDAAVRAIEAARMRIEKGDYATRNELMGLEGLASRAYYYGYARTLTQDLGFTGRAKRPPRDPVNALLSYGYTMLFGTVSSVIRRVGLDPYLGVLHADEDGRESLALDLLEPFRPLIVDVVARTIVNRRTLQAMDFEQGPDGAVLLGRKGIPVLVGEYQRRLESTVRYGERREKTEWQRVLELYARELARALESRGGADLIPVPVLHRWE